MPSIIDFLIRLSRLCELFYYVYKKLFLSSSYKHQYFDVSATDVGSITTLENNFDRYLKYFHCSYDKQCLENWAVCEERSVLFNLQLQKRKKCEIGLNV